MSSTTKEERECYVRMDIVRELMDKFTWGDNGAVDALLADAAKIEKYVFGEPRLEFNHDQGHTPDDLLVGRVP